MPSLTTEKLLARASTLARTEAPPGAPKDLRVARAKRAYELQLRAAGLTRSQAKTAVSVRFGQGRQ